MDRLYRHAAAVTTHDTNAIPTTTALYIGGAGGVKVDLSSGATVTFASVPAGTVLPIQAVRVYATGTAATNIVALY